MVTKRIDAKGLVLASGSPFRKQLLESTGLKFSVIPAHDVDESKVLGGGGPHGLAAARAEAKARSVARGAAGSLVLGADQVLGLGTETIDKVATRELARKRLERLSGRSHELHSAVCLAFRGGNDRMSKLLFSFVVSIPMQMRTLTSSEIEAYLDTGEWQGCVGCYQFENQGVNLFEGCFNDTSAIIGLPLIHLLKELRALGLNPLQNPLGPWTLSWSSE